MYLKNTFWPIIFVGAALQLLKLWDEILDFLRE